MAARRLSGSRYLREGYLPAKDAIDATCCGSIFVPRGGTEDGLITKQLVRACVQRHPERRGTNITQADRLGDKAINSRRHDAPQCTTRATHARHHRGGRGRHTLRDQVPGAVQGSPGARPRLVWKPDEGDAGVCGRAAAPTPRARARTIIAFGGTASSTPAT